MATDKRAVTGLPELVEALYEVLMQRGASIECEFENMEVLVPQAPGPNAAQSRWRIHGKLRVRTSDAGAHGGR